MFLQRCINSTQRFEIAHTNQTRQCLEQDMDDAHRLFTQTCNRPHGNGLVDKFVSLGETEVKGIMWQRGFPRGFFPYSVKMVQMAERNPQNVCGMRFKDEFQITGRILCSSDSHGL